MEKVWKHLDRLSGRSMGRMAARTPHVIRKTRRARSWRVIRLTLSSVIGLLNSNMHSYIDTVIDQSCYAHIKYRTFVNYIIKIYILAHLLNFKIVQYVTIKCIFKILYRRVYRIAKKPHAVHGFWCSEVSALHITFCTKHGEPSRLSKKIG